MDLGLACASGLLPPSERRAADLLKRENERKYSTRRVTLGPDASLVPLQDHPADRQTEPPTGPVLPPPQEVNSSKILSTCTAGIPGPESRISTRKELNTLIWFTRRSSVRPGDAHVRPCAPRRKDIP